MWNREIKKKKKQEVKGTYEGIYEWYYIKI